MEAPRPRAYKTLTPEGTVLGPTPGTYAGHRRYKIFGTLTCWSGKRMHKSNRVFFQTLEHAILCGYRPCRNCHPLEDQDFDKIRHLVDEPSLSDLYSRHSPGL